MASSDVVKNVVQLKRQLTEKTKSTTVLKILQTLKDLDITLDILAETGIGKTVNSFRKHEQAGELAKSLVGYWKTLIPKDTTSSTVDGEALHNMNKAKSDYLNGSKNESLSKEKLRSRCLDSPDQSKDASDVGIIQTENSITEKKRLQDRGQKDENDNVPSRITVNEHLINTLEKRVEATSSSTFKKKNHIDKRQDYSKTSEDDPESKSNHLSNSDAVNVGQHIKRQQSKKSTLKLSDEAPSCESNGRNNALEYANGTYCCRSEIPESSQNGEKKNSVEEKRTVKSKLKSENEEKPNVKNKKSKKQSQNDLEKPSMSFESYLSYDLNASKRKERSGTKNTCKKFKSVEKSQTNEKELTKKSMIKSTTLSTSSDNIISSNVVKRSVMDFLNTPLPAYLSEFDNPSCTDYFEGKVMKTPDICNNPEEPVFTGQRLNRKMQVYSGSKTAFLPTMMTLYQQCIRTLQNNIDLLYDTGGVPFEILESVLERCTPEQLLRIEEFNPVYVGVTDHLWGKHCQRDFRNAKLQEYESWKEMYIRLSEERERKLKKLTKTIVSAHSKRPKGRQVKMAFIHTVAKPPRNVRIQQEIHGTAGPIQQPHLARPSARLQDNRVRQSCVEPSKSNTTSSGTSNSQDPRKKTRVAPMMAKSLKAFKKLGRR